MVVWLSTRCSRVKASLKTDFGDSKERGLARRARVRDSMCPISRSRLRCELRSHALACCDAHVSATSPSMRTAEKDEEAMRRCVVRRGRGNSAWPSTSTPRMKRRCLAARLHSANRCFSAPGRFFATSGTTSSIRHRYVAAHRGKVCANSRHRARGSASSPPLRRKPRHRASGPRSRHDRAALPATEFRHRP